MEPFKTFRGVVAALDRANVDTDQVIPKQFLKSIKRSGFGENLFFDWRYLANGKPNPDFSLNAPQFKDASILVARNNFGCGSSREHAVWAIQQYGFRAVVAPYQERDGRRLPAFADIFRNNCAKNGLLTIELTASEVDQIFEYVKRFQRVEATVDLRAERITFHVMQGVSFRFPIESSVKDRLSHGLDDIGITFRHEVQIDAFEARHNPQLYPSGQL